METLHATSVAPSLSWKDSLKSPSRLNGKRCEQKWEGRFGSGPFMFRFQALKVESRSSISSWPTRDSAQCDSSVGGSGIRHRNLGQNFSGGNHAVAGRASPWTTSDDDEETSYVQPRVKMLQDAVGPNKTLLDAQARVCTGPTQTRPLDEAQAFKVLNTVLQSARGELPDSERVSKSQMGAFFGAMTLRANCFATPTQWSEGERKAMLELWPALCERLPEEVLFLVDPEGTIMGGSLNLGPRFTGNSLSDAQLVSGLRKVMTATHLEKEELAILLKRVLPLQGPKGDVSDALLAAFMICSRMICETDRELDAYCMTFDEELGSVPIAKVKSLTHYGEPYDGNTRFFRSSLFVAAVRASYGETCLLHGVDRMPPKGGVTEEQMLKHLGAITNLIPKEAVKLLECTRYFSRVD